MGYLHEYILIQIPLFFNITPTWFLNLNEDLLG
jgi:hypothetical protein